MDFSAVTRVVLELYSNKNVLQHTEDSNNSPSLISWSSNNITFNISGLAVANGSYDSQVTIYDSVNADGQVIAHPDSPIARLVFRFVHA